MEPLLCLEISKGHVLTGANSFSNAVHAFYLLHFKEKNMIIECKNRKDKNMDFKINGKTIKYTWSDHVDVKNRDITVIVSVDKMKSSLRSITRNKTVTLKLQEIEGTGLNEQKSLRLLFFNSSLGSESGVRHIDVERTNIPVEEYPLADENLITSKGTKYIKTILASFADNKPTDVYIFKKGIALMGDMKDNAGPTMEFLGDLYENEMEELKTINTQRLQGKEIKRDNKMTITGLIKTLKNQCGIEDAPILIYYTKESDDIKRLSFSSFVSYLGMFNYHIRTVKEE